MAFVAIATVEASRDSITFDEGWYLASGVTMLTRHDARINLHPPLAKLVAGLPALAAHPVIPGGPAWDRADELGYTTEFLAANRSAGRLRRLVLLGRLGAIACAVLGALLLWRLTARLAEPLVGASAAAGAATIAMAAWCLWPFVIGLGHLVTLDGPFAVAAVATALALERWWWRPSPATAAALVAAATAAALVRHSGLALVAVAAAALAARRWRVDRAAAVRLGALGLASAWAGVWVTYLLVSPGRPRGLAARVLADRLAGARSGSLLARVLTAVPWPRPYAAGIGALVGGRTAPAPAFLLGHAWVGGRWWFWPAALLVKTPLPMLAAAGLAVAGVVSAGRRRGWRGLASVATVAVATALPVVLQPSDLGLRYLLPSLTVVVPLLGIGLMALTPRRGRLALLAFVALTAGLLPSALGVATGGGSLAWTSIPGRTGYQVATDSNLDWGQDVHRLRTWAAHHQGAIVEVFAPPGAFDAASVGLVALPSASGTAVDGWVAVSASWLTAYGHDELAWLRAWCPVAVLGGTIAVYRLPAGTTVGGEGPDEPAAPCAGRAWSQRRR